MTAENGDTNASQIAVTNIRNISCPTAYVSGFETDSPIAIFFEKHTLVRR